MNIIARTYVSYEEINEHAVSITVTKAGEVGFTIRFLHMFHHRHVNETRLLLCKSNR